MNNNFKFYLKLISLGQNFLYQITEPVGFDVVKYIEKQNANRYSRDVNYALDLTFYHAIGNEILDVEQVVNPLGFVSNYLNMGLDWILESHKKIGFESKIEFHLSNNDVFFYVGLLDSANADTNEYDYYSCKIIQDNNIADYKKHEDTVLDMFGIKNVKNEIITAATTSRVLKKGVSVFRNSKWNCPQIFNTILFTVDSQYDEIWLYFNHCQNLIKSDLKNSLSWLSNSYISFNYDENIKNNFKVFKSFKTITNFKLNFTNFSFFQDFKIPNAGEGRSETRFVIRWGLNHLTPIGEIVIFSFSLNEDETYNFSGLSNFEYTIPILEKGFSVWIYGETRLLQTQDFSLDNQAVVSNINFPIYELEISGTEIAIDTVIPMVRYIDMMKQCSKNINNTSILAPKFDVGGQFYNQFCFNRALISQKTDKPFYTKFKEILGSVNEVNGDYEITKENIFVGQYPDFYQNVENAVFKIIPNKEAKSSWNKRFQINTLKFFYKIFEQNRNSKNTSEAIHTNSDYIIPNLQVENKKEIACELIRDPYSHQALIDLEITKPQTSDENDDKIYINDVVDLPNNSQGKIKGVLGIRIINGQYQILNREIEQEEEQSVINWLSIGVEIGQSIILNNVSFVIFSITRTVLTLNTNGGSPDANYFLDISWTYQNVLFKSKTNEGYDEITGVSNPTTYQGLDFSIRRNLKHFESFLATACIYLKNGIIRNNYFKNSPSLATRKNTESVLLSENSDLIINDLQQPILTAKIYKLEVYASYLQYINYQIAKKLNRGFIRCLWIDGRVIKGYPQELDYSFRTGNLELTLEEKYEPIILKINVVGLNLFVNDAIYELSGNAKWFIMSREYLQLFDINNLAISNPYLFSDVKLNNIIYNSPDSLLSALNLLVL